jgi:tRNA threonylcarbamoyladenosine biosynthesis protein TsaE
MKSKIILENLKETMLFGQKLALKCSGGDIFSINGPLGAGKTSLVQGMAKGLGVKETVNSPTFNIIKIYKFKNLKSSIQKFIHIDAYRLKSSQELLDLGIEEIFISKNSLILIEWGDKVKEILPKNTKNIRIDYFKNNQRILYLS